MARFGLFSMLVLLTACGSPNATPEDKDVETEGSIAGLFKQTTPPYSLTDSTLLNNKDTAQIRNPGLLEFIPDSVTDKAFGSKAKVRYTPLALFSGGKDLSYYLVKGSSGAKRAAFLMVADKDKAWKGFLPFLIPDQDETTFQQTFLDKNLTVSRVITRKPLGEPQAEGKDVYAFSEASGRFELIMTEPLDNRQMELINPIDTLSRTSKFSGDYGREKNNLVSIRDGRKPGLLTVFIHIEKNKGACTGEIKGDAEITGANTAVYRQAGDPCVLKLVFTKTGVTLEEQEGCGSRRGLECSFNGSFARKKEAKVKTPKR